MLLRTVVVNTTVGRKQKRKSLIIETNNTGFIYPVKLSEVRLSLSNKHVMHVCMFNRDLKNIWNSALKDEFSQGSIEITLSGDYIMRFLEVPPYSLWIPARTQSNFIWSLSDPVICIMRVVAHSLSAPSFGSVVVPLAKWQGTEGQIGTPVFWKRNPYSNSYSRCYLLNRNLSYGQVSIPTSHAGPRRESKWDMVFSIDTFPYV